MIPIPIIDSLINTGKSILDKIWMDKSDKEKIEITKQELKQNFELTLKQMEQSGELQDFENTFKEHQAQRQFANEQFGTMDALSKMGWVGKAIALGRASIRWIITCGSMFFTWKIINIVLTEKAVAALFAGTLGASAATILGLLITLVVGIPVFYVSGISVEKILKVRGQI